MLRGTALALPSSVSKGLKKRIRERAQKSDFADKMLEIAARIERDFDGRERERLGGRVGLAGLRAFQVGQVAFDVASRG